MQQGEPFVFISINLKVKECFGISPPHVDDVCGRAEPLLVQPVPPQHQVVPVGRIVFDLPRASCDRRGLPVRRGGGDAAGFTWKN